jgi:flagellar biosynthesis component FlhA
MRDRVKANFGINIPGIRLRANPALAAEAYLFMIDEVPIARGNVHVGMYFFEGAIDVLNELGLADQSISDIQPLTHKTGHWVPDSAQTAIQAAEHELIPAPTHLLDQFEALIRRNLVRFFGIQDAETLLQSWESSETSKSLVVALHLTSRDRLRLIQVLRELIRDRVPLTQGETILNALQGTNLASDDIHHLTRLVRLQIRHQLPSNTPGTIRVPIPLVEEQKLFTITDGRALFIASPQQKHEFLVWLRDQLQELQTDPFNIVLVTPNPEPRPLLRRLIEPEFPDLMVLSQEEILEFSETLSSSSSDESPTTKPSESPPLTTTPTPNDESEEVTE